MDITETDTVERRAEIYFWTRPAELSGSATASSLLGNANIRNLQHWMLVVKFVDKTLYLEGQNMDDLLVPKVYHEKPANNMSKLTWVGTKTISPASVIKMVTQNKLNYTAYNSTNNNCQHWLLEMLKWLGVATDRLPASSDIVVENFAAGVGIAGVALIFFKLLQRVL